MTTTLTLVVCMAILTWLTLMGAAFLRSRGWTGSGIGVAMGNRENMPELSPLAGRAERTARNTLENFVLFAALALVGHAVSPDSAQLALGAQIFFWSRLLFVAVYYAGIAYLRTAVWGVGIVGLAIMIAALL